VVFQFGDGKTRTLTRIPMEKTSNGMKFIWCQLYLRLIFARTVYRSQGMTLQRAVINYRKGRNDLWDILETSLKVGPVSPLETNINKERSLFLDSSIQHVNAEHAMVSVSRSVILFPSYQPGISGERSSRKLMEHNGLKSYSWSTIQDIHTISNNIANRGSGFMKN
jgi:hypothetical protein